MVVKMHEFPMARLLVVFMTAGMTITEAQNATPTSTSKIPATNATPTTEDLASPTTENATPTSTSTIRATTTPPIAITEISTSPRTENTDKIPVTTISPATSVEEFTFSQTPSTLAPAKGVNAENCIWKPLRTNYQYLRVITNATWFDWYLNNCFPMHIGEILFFQPTSDNQWTQEAIPLSAPETEQGCYFLKYYNNGAYIKVITNTTWFWWYINNCFPKYQGVYLPFQDSPTTETTTEVQATTPDSCILEEYFPDGNYVKVITNTTWFDWYMSQCYPKYIGNILPMIPLIDYTLSPSMSTKYSPPVVETTTVVNTKQQFNFCFILNKYIRKQSFTSVAGSSWYPWYLYNCPETDYKCC
ncbi:uncharacterized protein LOC117173040 isoform X2 [Belonocnema kinseyi]|uniref:uncharacterized protein LOC117173040 isoform X2 n=1 Tax=Belonocnema kinseyi TaxID=2817044 RepID=UPI00143E09CE|nr:uncharacterized protein LOC117173040 isoform X2 [Belonocnema kinseyi]